jgi:hypothetical protein
MPEKIEHFSSIHGPCISTNHKAKIQKQNKA